MFNFFKSSPKHPNKPAEHAVSEQAESAQNQPVESSTDNDGKQNNTFTQRLKHSLTKTRLQLGGQLNAVFGTGRINDETFEEIESILLTSDVGISTTEYILGQLKQQIKHAPTQTNGELKLGLKNILLSLLQPLQSPLVVNTHQPFVIMMVGVNGAGKTTTIGKLAKQLQVQGYNVLIAAGDTFRAAAREQLQAWGERNQVHVIASEGADPSAVIYDAVQSAIAKKIDVVIADTAGRLPTQIHLMDEIKKVQRVIGKACPQAPHEVLLVLDATMGQNALNQLHAFNDTLGVTGLVLSKLDGTAKGGVIAAIAHQRSDIPVRYIGIGETIDDLRPFEAQAFVNAIFDD